MEFSATTMNQLSTANSPEEAYKIFVGAVSGGLAQLLADAVAKTVATVSVAAATPDRRMGVVSSKACACTWHWGTPGL